jgi:hypothetical protein
VEGTWKTCAGTVSVKVFFNCFGTNQADRSLVVHLRTSLRLRFATRSLESSPSRGVDVTGRGLVNVVRFNETINGRPYLIEVLSVGRDRWRAQIVGAPGGRTALMPFYGATPDAAAHQLASWLTRAATLPPRA